MQDQTLTTWIETPFRTSHPVERGGSIGRTNQNAVVLLDPEVSRRHAVINFIEPDEYWLVDLGSSNGTAVNGRRIQRPTRLADGDRIAVGRMTITFRCQLAASAPPALSEFDGAPTMMMLRHVPTWLLMVDLVGFTPLSQQLAPVELAAFLDRFHQRCAEIINRHGGTICKFLGDGFLADWEDGEGSAARIAAAVRDYLALQRDGDTPFRFVIHHGEVAVGGGVSFAEGKVFGPTVNYIFRVEKIAGSHGIAACLSEAAARAIGTELPTQQIPGEHELKGFTEPCRLYEVA